MTEQTTTAPTSDRLGELRAEIGHIDDRLLALVRDRLAVCERIAEHKREAGIPMMQPDRLEALGEKVEAFAAEHGIDPLFLSGLYGHITEETCRLEDEIIDGSGGGDSGGLGSRARRIDHVAIAVSDLDEAITYYRERYGFTLLERRRVHGEISGMDSATMRAGGVTFVLVEGDSEQSNVSKYIAAYGPGVQHIAIDVRDQPGLLTELDGRGADLLTGVIHSQGLDQSFTKREPNSGIQLEFVTRTRADGDGFDENNIRELFEAMEREDVY
jgi:chorismate mutase-like protein